MEIQEENGGVELQVLTRGRVKRNSTADAEAADADETPMAEDSLANATADADAVNAETNPADNAETNLADETSLAEDSLATPEDITSQLEGNEGKKKPMQRQKVKKRTMGRRTRKRKHLRWRKGSQLQKKIDATAQRSQGEVTTA